MRFAGQHGANLDALDAGRLDRRRQVFVYLLVDIDNHVAFVVLDLFQRNAAHDAVAERFHNFARFHDGLDEDSVERAAIEFGDDHVLRHIHQTAGEVTGIGRLQCGIRQPFTRAVRGDEVLQHVQPFAEIRGDGGLDDFARGLGHQAAHSGELADLLFEPRAPESAMM